MDGLEAQTGGDLGEVEPSLPDHPFCGIDFKFVEVVDDAAAGLLVEVALQLGAAHQIVPADLVEGEGLIQPLLEGAKRYYEKYVFHACRQVRFALASLGNDAGAYGAFKLILDAQ